MYNSFFGFKEKPFKLVPNPDYLFMSKSHEIAMAHLIYAMDQGDGFVVITGEVGTGKTTLCRNFLELLDEHTESAYIFNPNMNAAELLASICKEFGISHKNGTVKELLDALNEFLMRQNEAGRKAILLIDEAQNLTVENLEMVRMLSNLETTRSKLLQIILVGQPELNDKLDAHELRQLAQRISLNYYLTPLSAKETAGYIQHRLHIAAQRQMHLFTARAHRLIHRYANGIPRLINIACDRALLTAYSLNVNKVSGPIVKTALKELAGRGSKNPAANWIRQLVWGGVVAGLIALAATAVIYGGAIHRLMISEQNAASTRQAEPSPGADFALSDPATPVYKVPAPVPQSAVSAELDPTPAVQTFEAAYTTQESAKVPEPEAAPLARADTDALAEPADSIALHIAELDPEYSRIHAAQALLELWQQPNPNLGHIPTVIDDGAFFEIAARQYGMRLYIVPEDWPLVQRLNLPAIIAVHHPQPDQTAYLTLVGWHGERVYLQDQNTRKVWDTEFDALRPHLQGTAYILWKNILGYDSIISQGAESQSVLLVKAMLRQVGYEQVALTPVFDRTTTAAVVDFQIKHQLAADGLVGPLTKIMLINAAKAFERPQLDADRGTGA